VIEFLDLPSHELDRRAGECLKAVGRSPNAGHSWIARTDGRASLNITPYRVGIYLVGGGRWSWNRETGELTPTDLWPADPATRRHLPRGVTRPVTAESILAWWVRRLSDAEQREAVA